MSSAIRPLAAIFLLFALVFMDLGNVFLKIILYAVLLVVFVSSGFRHIFRSYRDYFWLQKEEYYRKLPMSIGATLIACIISTLLLITVLFWDSVNYFIKNLHFDPTQPILDKISSLSLLIIFVPLTFLYLRLSLYKLSYKELSVIKNDFALYASMISFLFGLFSQFEMISSGISILNLRLLFIKSLLALILSIFAALLRSLYPLIENRNKPPDEILIAVPNPYEYRRAKLSQLEKTDLMFSTISFLFTYLSLFLILWIIVELILYSVLLV